jgi:hypothetical protein
MSPAVTGALRAASSAAASLGVPPVSPLVVAPGISAAGLVGGVHVDGEKPAARDAVVAVPSVPVVSALAAPALGDAGVPGRVVVEVSPHAASSELAHIRESLQAQDASHKAMFGRLLEQQHAQDLSQRACFELLSRQQQELRQYVMTWLPVGGSYIPYAMDGSAQQHPQYYNGGQPHWQGGVQYHHAVHPGGGVPAAPGQ